MAINNEDALDYLAQGRALMGKQLYEEAVTCFDRCINADPMVYEVYIDRGVAYANLDQFEKAQECFQKAIKIDKKNPEAFFHLGNVLFVNDDYVSSIEHYNEAMNLGYQEPELFYNLGMIHQEREEYSLSIRNYNRAIQLNPLEPRYYVRKASYYLSSGKYVEATQTLDELRKMCPDTFEGYHLATGAYLLMGKMEEAEHILDKAELLFPLDIEIIYDRIRVCSMKGDFEQALTYIESAVNLVEDLDGKASVLIEKAKIFGEQGELGKCRELLETVADMGGDERNHNEAHFLLMNLYIVDNKFDKVKKEAERLKKVTSDDNYSDTGYYYYAMSIMKLGEEGSVKAYKDAISYYRQKTLNNPGYIPGYLFRAICHKDIKEYEKSLELLNYILLLDKENAGVYKMKAELLKTMDRLEEAEKVWKIAKALNPEILDMGDE